MTHREKIIATAYTGIMFVDGSHLGEVYKYEEEKLGHGVVDIMHASKEYQKEVRDAVREDFLAMIHDDEHDDEHEVLTKEMLQEWIDEAASSSIAYGALCRNEKRDYFDGQRDAFLFVLNHLFNVPYIERVFPINKVKRQQIIDSIFETCKPRLK